MSPAVVFSAKTSLDVGIESGDPHPSVHDHRERTKKHRPTQTPPKLLPTSLIIRRWDEPFLESTGFEARSEYVERFWLPTLGPTATWLFRRFVRGLDLHPSGIRIGSEDTSRSIGLGGGTGRSSPLSKGIDRMPHARVPTHRATIVASAGSASARSRARAVIAHRRNSSATGNGPCPLSARSGRRVSRDRESTQSVGFRPAARSCGHRRGSAIRSCGIGRLTTLHQ